MTLRRNAAGCFLAAWLAVATASAADGPVVVKPWKPPASQAPAQTPYPIPGAVMDTARYLPDSTVLAVVDGRHIRVGEFVDRYFESWAATRPKPDSAGRVEFLNSMIQKEILARVARAVHAPESFEDRIAMREHTERVLSNTFFQRAVLDSVHVDESEVEHVFRQMNYELHLRRLVFRDLALAERIRADVASRRITWGVAAAAQEVPTAGAPPDGDIGWVTRQSIDDQVATEVFDLPPGSISPVLLETLGHTIYQAMERRDTKVPMNPAARRMIRNQLRNVEIARRGRAILAVLAERIGMTHDTTNIVWAAQRFPDVITSEGGRHFEVDPNVPEFDPVDTTRVLARFRGGQFTLGQFLAWYGAQPALTRASITTFAALMQQVDTAILEPTLADLARARGLDQDPMAAGQIEKRREELMVEHLYEDSILARVRTTPAQRRAYYQKHLRDFVTYARVRYAAFTLNSQAEAESLAARLRAGVTAETILQEDSQAGRSRGAIDWRSEEDRGTPFYTALMGELKPGQVSVQPPDRRGHYTVLQSIAFDPGRQLSYAESEGMIDESVRNIEAERLLVAFIRRHEKGMRVTARPELVMRIRLVDPTL